VLSRVEASLVDEVGVLYEDEHAFYRCIHPESEAWALEVTESGLIEQLVSEGLFPATRISARVIDGHRLVLEHEMVGVPTYPFEWSPEMLRAAGLCVAKVNDVCNRYGYELKDAHPFNVVFDGCRPVFVDFGSIAKLPKRNRSDWKAANEFERTFRFPLYFHSKGAYIFFRNAFVSPGQYYDYPDYLAFRFPVLRVLPSRLFQIVARYHQAYLRFACVDMTEAGRRWGKWAQSLLHFVQNLGVIPLRQRSSEKLGVRLAKLKISKGSTWGDYQRQAGFVDEDGQVHINARFHHVVDLVKKLRPRQVTELACNEGVLAEHISHFDFVDQVVCCDNDEQAIDSLFKRASSRSVRLNPLMLDFILPVRNVLARPVEDRVRGDMVIALAVVHHLALKDCYGFETIFKAIAKYTLRYAIVEFMPLGLWDGKSAPPIPAWYSEGAFRQSLEPLFNIVEMKKVEENRIVYLLEKDTGIR
jgi:hypothetical protein